MLRLAIYVVINPNYDYAMVNVNPESALERLYLDDFIRQVQYLYQLQRLVIHNIDNDNMRHRTMQNESDRRQSFRMRFHAEAICFMVEDDSLVKGIIRDISISGIYIEVEECRVCSGPCEIHIMIVGDHSRLDITKISGEIVRCEKNGVAITFDNPLEWVALIPICSPKISMQLDKIENSLFRRP